VARIWEKRRKYGILVGKPDGSRPLGRPGVWDDENVPSRNAIGGRCLD